MTRIACVQTAPVLGQVDRNIEVTSSAIADAVAAGADIVVLTELATSGYMFTDAAEAARAARRPDDPVFGSWIAAAGTAVVVGGFCELGDAGLIHNSALLIDAGEIVGCYRKTHLWDTEKLIFTAGDKLPAVVDTTKGRIAVMVCYDIEFPEVTRRAAVEGAEVIAAPVNWPLAPRPEGEHAGEVITAMSAARTNRVVIAACDRTGEERGQLWTEGTVIIDPDGWIVVSAGPGTGTAIADIDLNRTHDKTLSEYVHVHDDRRTDLY